MKSLCMLFYVCTYASVQVLKDSKNFASAYQLLEVFSLFKEALGSYSSSLEKEIGKHHNDALKLCILTNTSRYSSQVYDA